MIPCTLSLINNINIYIMRHPDHLYKNKLKFAVKEKERKRRKKKKEGSC